MRRKYIVVIVALMATLPGQLVMGQSQAPEVRPPTQSQIDADRLVNLYNQQRAKEAHCGWVARFALSQAPRDLDKAGVDKFFSWIYDACISGR